MQIIHGCLENRINANQTLHTMINSRDQSRQAHSKHIYWWSQPSGRILQKPLGQQCGKTTNSQEKRNISLRTATRSCFLRDKTETTTKKTQLSNGINCSRKLKIRNDKSEAIGNSISLLSLHILTLRSIFHFESWPESLIWNEVVTIKWGILVAQTIPGIRIRKEVIQKRNTQANKNLAVPVR